MANWDHDDLRDKSHDLRCSEQIEKAEYWHMDPDGEGMAGPYDTIEAAQKDAELVLHNRSYRINEVKIVKTVAVSRTKVTYATTWGPK